MSLVGRVCDVKKKEAALVKMSRAGQKCGGNGIGEEHDRAIELPSPWPSPRGRGRQGACDYASHYGTGMVWAALYTFSAASPKYGENSLRFSGGLGPEYLYVA